MKNTRRDTLIAFRINDHFLGRVQQAAAWYNLPLNAAVRQLAWERLQMPPFSGETGGQQKPVDVPKELAHQTHAIEEICEEMGSLNAAVRSLLKRARIPVDGEYDDEDDET